MKASLEPSDNPLKSLSSSQSSIMLVAIHWFAPSGAEYYALECARIAKEEGYEVVWVVDFPSPGEYWRQDFLGVSPYAVLIWQESSPLKAIVRAVNEVGGEVGVIHIHHSPFFYDNLSTLRSLFDRAQVIDSTHIIEIGGDGFPLRSLQAGNGIDVRNVISQGLMDYFSSHGVDRNSVYRTAIIPTSFESCLEKGGDSFSIGVVGRLSQQKRPYIIPSLLRRLDNVFSQSSFSGKVVFYIYGYGPYADYLKRPFDLKFIDVCLVEHCYDRAEIYGSLNCVLQISENEGVSIVSYEAAAYRIPFLAADVGQQSEMVCPELLLPAHPRKMVLKAAEIIVALAVMPESYNASVKWQSSRLSYLRQNYGYQERMRQLYRRMLA